MRRVPNAATSEDLAKLKVAGGRVSLFANRLVTLTVTTPPETGRARSSSRTISTADVHFPLNERPAILK